MRHLIGVVLFLTITLLSYAPMNALRDVSLIEAHKEYEQKKIANKKIDLILKTIRIVESGEDYTINGASTETGAYQFMKPTWDYYSKKFFGKILDISKPANQDKVARRKVQMLVDKGYSPAQIASIWNSGSPRWQGKVGVNRYGIPYDVPRHVHRFMKVHKKLSATKGVSIMRRTESTMNTYSLFFKEPQFQKTQTNKEQLSILKKPLPTIDPLCTRMYRNLKKWTGIIS